MGTSSRYTGPGASNPLLPSWLEPAAPQPAPDQSEGGEQTAPEAHSADAEQDGVPLPAPPPLPPAQPYPRFQGARVNLNKAARTGDRSYVRKAVANYVSRGTGGSRSAAARMAVSSRTAGRLIGFANDVRDRGFVAAARDFGIRDLSGRPVAEAVSALMEAFCPAGGNIDEAIAREAWNDALLEAVEDGVVDFTNLTPEQWAVLVQEFIAHSIEARVIADIGADSFSDATTVERIDEIQMELRDLISGAVRAAIGPLAANNRRTPAAECRRLADKIYAQAFAYLAAVKAE